MTEASITIDDIEIQDPNKRTKVVKIGGQLDESNVDEKIQIVYQALQSASGKLNLIFDLEKLEYMNSKSIGYLTDIYGKVTEAGGTVLISAAKPNILDILQVVGLTQLIPSYASTNEAIAAINTTTTQTPPAQP